MFFVIILLLYMVFHSVAEAAVLNFPRLFAMTGSLILQWWLGYNFSVAVWLGYIALFGIAVETGVVTVVYLHEALDRRFASGESLKHEDIEQARGLLFPSSPGHRGLEGPISDKTIWYACKIAASKAGIKKRIGPHTLRHCSAWEIAATASQPIRELEQVARKRPVTPLLAPLLPLLPGPHYAGRHAVLGAHPIRCNTDGRPPCQPPSPPSEGRL